MTRGVPKMGYRMRTCFNCKEQFNPKQKEITYEQWHGDENCKMYEWMKYTCGCENIRKKIEKKLGLDTKEKQDNYYDNLPNCTCSKHKWVWVCEDCRLKSC